MKKKRTDRSVGRTRNVGSSPVGLPPPPPHLSWYGVACWLEQRATLPLGVANIGIAIVLHYFAPQDLDAARHWWQFLAVGIASTSVSVCRPIQRWLERM
jgi:hypothetical protein